MSVHQGYGTPSPKPPSPIPTTASPGPSTAVSVPPTVPPMPTLPVTGHAGGLIALGLSILIAGALALLAYRYVQGRR